MHAENIIKFGQEYDTGLYVYMAFAIIFEKKRKWEKRRQITDSRVRVIILQLKI